MVISLMDLDFSAIDQTAITIVVVGISIVFSALLLIYLIFKYVLPLILKIIVRRKVKKTGSPEATAKIHEIPGDVNAAIALALYLYLNEMHDEESSIITIKRVSRNYSPWSSKLYNMRNLK